MRHFFINLSIFLGYSVNPLLMAQGATVEIQNLIQNFKVDPSHISLLIDRLLQRGKISQREALEAKKRLRKLQSEDIKNMIMDAFQNSLYEKTAKLKRELQ